MTKRKRIVKTSIAIFMIGMFCLAFVPTASAGATPESIAAVLECMKRAEVKCEQRANKTDCSSRCMPKCSAKGGTPRQIGACFQKCWDECADPRRVQICFDKKAKKCQALFVEE